MYRTNRGISRLAIVNHEDEQPENTIEMRHGETTTTRNRGRVESHDIAFSRTFRNEECF